MIRKLLALLAYVLVLDCAQTLSVDRPTLPSFERVIVFDPPMYNPQVVIDDWESEAI